GELCKPDDRIMILAPIVRGRKGAYRKELEKLAQDGFVRVRINGELLPLDETPVLDKRKNHTIEVVIDRLLVKQGIASRLEQSIATALKLAQGLVTVAVVGGKEHVFSERLACPDCGLSVPQLEPRSFSFNSPFGACPTCTGLGMRWKWDPEKLIVDPTKPILDGALGIGGTSGHVTGDLRLLGLRLKIPIQKPFEKLAKKWQAALIEGLIAALDHYYEQEDVTEGTREWLLEYQSAAVCPDCQGKRLKPSSLAVK